MHEGWLEITRTLPLRNQDYFPVTLRSIEVMFYKKYTTHREIWKSRPERFSTFLQIIQVSSQSNKKSAKKFSTKTVYH